MTLLLALLSSPAAAQSPSMSLHIQGGGLPIADDGLGALYDYTEWPKEPGLRFGYAFSERAELLVTATGSTRYRNMATSGGNFESRLNTFSYGAGARMVGDSTFHPYAGAQVRLFQAGLRLDGDQAEDDNLDSSVTRVFTPGLTGALGLELRPQPDWVIQPSIFVEANYTWSLVSQVGQLGPAQFKGLTAQAGIGLRF
ncbi:MAG: hypothetical protein ACI9VR_001276 [Cognaticolwellia sp.]|jgi:hypothetical protein